MWIKRKNGDYVHIAKFNHMRVDARIIHGLHEQVFTVEALDISADGEEPTSFSILFFFELEEEAKNCLQRIAEALAKGHTMYEEPEFRATPRLLPSRSQMPA